MFIFESVRVERFFNFVNQDGIDVNKFLLLDISKK